MTRKEKGKERDKKGKEMWHSERNKEGGEEGHAGRKKRRKKEVLM